MVVVPNTKLAKRSRGKKKVFGEISIILVSGK